MVCAGISWLSEFLVMQALLTTYAFPNSSFPPGDHYQYYITFFLLGEFIGRSYLAVVSFIKEELVPKLMARELWELKIIEVCILIFCLFVTCTVSFQTSQHYSCCRFLLDLSLASSNFASNGYVQN